VARLRAPSYGRAVPTDPDSTWQELHAERSGLYDRLKDEVIFTLETELERLEIKTHTVTGRVKTVESLEQKSTRKDYADPLAQAGDIVGVRVVTLFRSDLSKVGDVVAAKFAVLSTDDKVDGAQDPSTFGYMSHHYGARLHPDHRGPRYDGLGDLVFEVQVRTLLMDAWANVSHYLAYKGESSIPEGLRRDFHALSGLFYVADKHFELFLGTAEDVRADAAQSIRSSTVGIPLNLETLAALLRERYPDRDATDRTGIAALVDELLVFDIDQLDSLVAALDEVRDRFLEYEAENPPNGAEGHLFSDVGVVRVSIGLHNPAFEAYQAMKSDRAEREVDPDDGSEVPDP
jgi:putative GTP pyrophosphokinase